MKNINSDPESRKCFLEKDRIRKKIQQAQLKNNNQAKYNENKLKGRLRKMN